MGEIVYGLPDETDLTFFIGTELQQVCIGRHEVILRFGDDLSITVESDIGHRSTLGELDAVFKTIVPAAMVLCNLINAMVSSASVKSPGTLVLQFSNGEALEIYDSNTSYESYQIACGDRLIVV